MGLCRTPMVDAPYVVVWDGRGDNRYLFVERDTVREPVAAAPKRRIQSLDMQGVVLTALRASTEPLSAYGLAVITGYHAKTCRVIMARAVHRGVAVRAGRRQETTRHYQQTWRAV